MKKHLVISCVAVVGLVCGLAPAQDRAADQRKIKELTAENERLKTDVETLKAQNAQLLQRISELEKRGGSTAEPAKPAGTEKPPAGETKMSLGGTATLGAYTHSVPEGWSAQAGKDSVLSKIFRTSDNSSIIMVRVRVKGGMIPEAQMQFEQSIIGMLKQDYAKSKTEVVEPPAARKDNRFYAKISERIKTKNDRIATQIHSYRNLDKDLIEMTAITTLGSKAEVAGFEKLADDMLLSFKK